MRAREQRRGGEVALWHLVADAQRLGHERTEIEHPGLAKTGAQQRAGLGGEPAQPRHHAVVVGAEPQHPAQALVVGVACARLPHARFSTTKTGIERVMIPVIGPTARQW